MMGLCNGLWKVFVCFIRTQMEEENYGGHQITQAVELVFVCVCALYFWSMFSCDKQPLDGKWLTCWLMSSNVGCWVLLNDEGFGYWFTAFQFCTSVYGCFSACATLWHLLFLWSPYVIGRPYIFSSCSFFPSSSFFFFSSPNLSGRRLDVYHTSTHGMALVRI